MEEAYLKICFLIMLVLHTFFNPEYSDNYGYKIGYQEFQSMSLIQVFRENSYSLKAETGYRVLCKLLSYISKEWRFGMFVISLIMLSGYYYAVKRYSSMIWLSILLIMVGPFCQSLFVLRQHLAMGIILFSYHYILQKKIVPYLLICFLAISCHQTAAVFLPIYFIYNMKKNYYVYILLSTAFFVAYFYFSVIIGIGASFAMDTASYGDSYLEYNATEGANSKTALLMITLLLARIFLLREEYFKEGINKLLSIILTIGTVISTAGIGFLGTPRLNMYFSTISFLFIPNTLQYLRGKDKQLFLGVAYFLFLLYFMVKSANTANMSDFCFFSKL